MKPIKPTKIRLETSSICQLRCPSCPTTSKAIHPAIGSGYLKAADFRQLLEKNPWIRDVELSNYGEIFLNPQLLVIMRIAHELGVALHATNGVNLNHMKVEILEGLVQFGFRDMTCSIDGTSQETYGRYRVGGNFERVIENVKKINEYKRKYQSPYPALAWQFIVFGFNEHEIPTAKRLAQELDMELRLKLSWDDEFSPIQDAEMVRREAGAVSRQEYKEKHGVDYKQGICHQLWDQPQINWDGKLLGCCRNFWGDFGGNVFENGLPETLNNEKISRARQMLLGQATEQPDIPCTNCEIYLGMKADGHWLKRRVKPFGLSVKKFRFGTRR